MNEYLKKIADEFNAFWQKLTSKQKILIIALVIFVSIGFIALMSWIRQPHYVVLYSKLTPEDAGLIVEKLKESKVDYQLSGEGTTIEVPTKVVYDIRIQLAKEGLPHKSEIGYELFDQNKLGMSDFMQKLSYRRALEGELRRTIQQMNEIELARVHIVIPEPSLFEEDKKEPTASIVVKLKPNAKLSMNQINGIAHLAAGSVEGLKAENINIIDFNGNILSNNSERDTMAGLTATQLELKKKVDNYLSSKIQSLFDNVLGSSNSDVRIDAELDFRRVETTSEIYEPENTTVRSEETVQETSASDTNQPNEIEHTTTNYEINKRVEHVLDTSGNIKRLSIAILVNGIYRDVEDENGEMVNQYIPRTQEELDQLAEIAKNAVGFNEQRNDRITVNNFQFDTSRFDMEREELDGYAKKQFWISLIQKAALGVAVLIFLLYLRSLLKKVIQKVPDPAEQIPVDDSGESQPISLDPDKEAFVLEPAKKNKEQERILAFAEEQPKDIALLIKTWLQEDASKNERAN